jgi:hypothetical protein
MLSITPIANCKMQNANLQFAICNLQFAMISAPLGPLFPGWLPEKD